MRSAPLQSIDALREAGDEFRQRPDQVRQSDDTGALRFGKAVWKAQQVRHESQSALTSTVSPLTSRNNDLRVGRNAMAPLGEVDVFVKAAIVRCRDRAGLKHEALAALMGISGPQLSMQLQPGGHLSLTRLLLAADDDDGKRFLQMLWNEVAEFCGLENADAVAQELKRFHGRLGFIVDKLQVRMAKAEIRQVERERKIG